MHGLESTGTARRISTSERVFNAVSNLSLLGVVLALGAFLVAGGASDDRSVQRSRPASDRNSASALDPNRFLLNALLVPALDTDALPLQWVDPRPGASCAPGTVVDVDGLPLVAGAKVPDVPFELSWVARNCRPLGRQGPRFDGGIRMVVFRENWGFSAMVDPAGLVVTRADGTSVPIRGGAATMPLQGADDFHRASD